MYGLLLVKAKWAAQKRRWFQSRLQVGPASEWACSPQFGTCKTPLLKAFSELSCNLLLICLRSQAISITMKIILISTPGVFSMNAIPVSFLFVSPGLWLPTSAVMQKPFLPPILFIRSFFTFFPFLLPANKFTTWNCNYKNNFHQNCHCP